MRSQDPRTDLMILGALGLGALVVIGIVLSLTGTSDDARSGAWVRSTQSTNLEGTMVAFELLRRLGFNPSRVDAPLSSTTLANVDVLFLIDPVVELRLPEQQALRQWVEGGGRLVSSGPLWSASRPFHGIARKGGVSRGLAASAAQSWRVPGEHAHLALAKDVQVVALSEEWTLESKQEDLPGMGPVEPLLADGYGLRVAARSVGAGAVINKDVPDFALMAGVPAKQVGWMSRFGERLDLPLKTDSETVCTYTGDRYKIKDGCCILIDQSKNIKK